MKNMKKKLIALLLLAATLLLTACTTGTVGTDTGSSTASGGNESTSSAPGSEKETETEVETEAHADLPDDLNYDGADFIIYCTGNLEWHDFESLEGDETVMGRATHLRNERANYKLGINIIEDADYLWGDSYGSGTGYKALWASFAAGQPACDFAMIGTHDVANLALSGALRDISVVDHLNIDAPYWNQKANAALRIGGKLPFTSTAFSTIVDAYSFCIFFNKKLAKEADLPNLYDIVEQGKWTVDVYNEYCRANYVDLNGNDEVDRDDKYGAIVWNDTILGAINACGGAIGVVNDGNLELTLYNDRVEAMVEKFTEVAYSDSCFNYQSVSVNDWQAVLKNMFIENRALFNLNAIQCSRHYRDTDVDYGILPWFKLDENQKDYACHIQEGGVQFYCIPVYVEDIDKTAYVTEYLAAESYNTIRPAFYDKHLIGRTIRDDESIGSLDIILSSQVFDVGAFYRIGGYTTDFFQFFLSSSTNFTSFYEERLNAATSAVDSINKQISTLE